MKGLLKFLSALAIFGALAAAICYFYKTYISDDEYDEDDEEVDMSDFEDEDDEDETEESKTERGYFNLDDVKHEAAGAEKE